MQYRHRRLQRSVSEILRYVCRRLQYIREDHVSSLTDRFSDLMNVRRYIRQRTRNLQRCFEDRLSLAERSQDIDQAQEPTQRYPEVHQLYLPRKISAQILLLLRLPAMTCRILTLLLALQTILKILALSKPAAPQLQRGAAVSLQHVRDCAEPSASPATCLQELHHTLAEPRAEALSGEDVHKINS